MNTRYNYKWVKPVKDSHPYREEYERIVILEPISFNADKKTIKEYKEVVKYVCHKTKWSDYIKSFDIGSVKEQVLNHLQKGTPLITSHTLPDGDYTPESLLKGADFIRQMKAKGVTTEMLEAAIKASKESKVKEEVVSSEGEVK